MGSSDHISNRVKDLSMAEGDILSRMSDIDAEKISLQDALQAIRLEKYQLTEIKAPGPLFCALRDNSFNLTNVRLF